MYKCICINNKHSSDSPNLPLLEVGKIYEYYTLVDLNNYVAIIGNEQLFTVDIDGQLTHTTYFHQFFVDVEEHREKQINKITQ